MQKFFFRIGVELFFGACCLAVVLMIDPARQAWGFNAVPALRYMLAVLTIIAWILMLFGGGRILLNWQSISIAMFIALVLGGSLYTIISTNADLMHSWMGRGLNALVVFPAYHVFAHSRARQYLSRRLVLIFAGAYIMMIFTLWGVTGRYIYSNLSQVYHMEAVFILSVGWSWLLTARRQRLWIGILLLGAIGFLIAVGKFTSYVLIAAAFGIFLSLLLSKTRFSTGEGPQAQKLLTSGLRLFLIASIVIGIFFFATEIVNARSDARESHVRDYAFTVRLEMIRDYPLVGTIFTGSPLLKISNLIVPSHSDWLDLAAFGGAVGLLLLLLPVGSVLWKSWQRISIRERNTQTRYLPIFSLFYLLLALVSMTFNPLISVPYLAFWFWFALGILLAYVNAQAFSWSEIFNHD